ncbi:hypothetical protein BHE74_00018925 [Ensete ventricosum]|nr:hypothetical protein GW17_00059200 [Ensete ventricosum]RWW73218.1 hypothetical protein BHE74_00018925 [Ensete ventricosum]RZS10767.1 hypothetical protein BHM03_00042036 [Ensete ventricosum]
MKNLWNNMIPLLPLRLLMSLTSVKGKLVPLLHVLSSMSTPLMWLGCFAKFHPSGFAPRFALS